MDKLLNFLELKNYFGIGVAIAISFFILALRLIFVDYKDKALKYISHKRNVWGFAYALQRIK